MLKQKTLRKGSKGYSAVSRFIVQWEKMAKSFLWSPPSNASSRRSYEKYNSDSISIVIDGKEYIGEIDVKCSCKNIYVTRTLTVDGETKRITALKKLLPKA